MSRQCLSHAACLQLHALNECFSAALYLQLDFLAETAGNGQFEHDADARCKGSFVPSEPMFVVDCLLPQRNVE
jgi:hypothetical protein